MSQEASNDKGAANILREWIDSGEVAIGDNGMPNIIKNREDLQEDFMWVKQVEKDGNHAFMRRTRSVIPVAVYDSHLILI